MWMMGVSREQWNNSCFWLLVCFSPIDQSAVDGRKAKKKKKCSCWEEKESFCTNIEHSHYHDLKLKNLLVSWAVRKNPKTTVNNIIANHHRTGVKVSQSTEKTLWGKEYSGHTTRCKPLFIIFLKKGRPGWIL